MSRLFVTATQTGAPVCLLGEDGQVLLSHASELRRFPSGWRASDRAAADNDVGREE
jgi:hypothetical protein